MTALSCVKACTRSTHHFARGGVRFDLLRDVDGAGGVRLAKPND